MKIVNLRANRAANADIIAGNIRLIDGVICAALARWLEHGQITINRSKQARFSANSPRFQSRCKQRVNYLSAVARPRLCGLTSVQNLDRLFVFIES